MARCQADTKCFKLNLKNSQNYLKAYFGCSPTICSKNAEISAKTTAKYNVLCVGFQPTNICSFLGQLNMIWDRRLREFRAFLLIVVKYALDRRVVHAE